MRHASGKVAVWLHQVPIALAPRLLLNRDPEASYGPSSYSRDLWRLSQLEVKIMNTALVSHILLSTKVRVDAHLS